MKQLRVYVRGALIAVVTIAILLVLFRNRAHKVGVWFFGLTEPAQPINVVWLMLCTAGATLVSWWVFSLGWKLARDVRDLKRERAAREADRRLQQRTTALDERERRLDQKLRRAVEDEPEVEDEDT